MTPSHGSSAAIKPTSCKDCHVSPCVLRDMYSYDSRLPSTAPLLLVQYPRNTFLFNVCFVLDARSDPAPYEPILRKVALTLYSLEEDREFISRPETRWQLHRMLHRILEDLNARKECLLILDDANLLSLKLVHVVQVGKMSCGAEKGGKGPV